MDFETVGLEQQEVQSLRYLLGDASGFGLVGRFHYRATNLDYEGTPDLSGN